MKTNLKKIIVVFYTLCFLTYHFNAISADEPQENEDSQYIASKEENNTDYISFDVFETNMRVGEQQTVTVIKSDSLLSNRVDFASSNETVAVVDDDGVVKALNEGTTEITAFCANENASFILSVNKENEEIAVEDIAIEDLQKEVYVGETFTIKATAIPENATNANVVYESHNDSILTVNSSGEVKGVSKGKTTITISAGSILKNIDIEVLVKTTSVYANTNYLVLNEGEGYQLKVGAMPSEASQNFVFSTSDSSIVSVDNNGYIKARNDGNALIIYGNSEMVGSVSIIVNQKVNSSRGCETSAEKDETSKYDSVLNKETCKKLTQDMLRYYYISNKDVVIESGNYSIKFSGKDIVNFENEFDTDLNLCVTNSGIEFNVSPNRNLFGVIKLEIADTKGKYLYIYNDTKSKYEYLGIISDNDIIISVEGKYLILDSKITYLDPFVISIGVTGCLTVIALSIIYIVKKKKYWFW